MVTSKFKLRNELFTIKSNRLQFEYFTNKVFIPMNIKKTGSHYWQRLQWNKLRSNTLNKSLRVGSPLIARKNKSPLLPLKTYPSICSTSNWNSGVCRSRTRNGILCGWNCRIGDWPGNRQRAYPQITTIEPRISTLFCLPYKSPTSSRPVALTDGAPHLPRQTPASVNLHFCRPVFNCSTR